MCIRDRQQGISNFGCSCLSNSVGTRWWYRHTASDYAERYYHDIRQQGTNHRCQVLCAHNAKPIRHAHASLEQPLSDLHLREEPVSYTHLRAHETRHDLVCRLLLEKKNVCRLLLEKKITCVSNRKHERSKRKRKEHSMDQILVRTSENADWRHS